MSSNNSYRSEIDEVTFDKIDQYLSGDMNVVEKQSFEKEIVSNPTLKKEVELQLKLITAIELKGIEDEVNTYFVVDTDEPIKVEKKKNLNLSFLLACAACLALLVGLFFIFQKEDLYAKYYEADPGLPSEMGVTDNYEFQDAMVDYKMEDYQIAKDKWGKIATENPANDTLNYFIAMADLNLSNMDTAYQTLDKIPTTSTFYIDALWYQALIAIKQKDYDLARAKLIELDTERASELLKELP